MTNLLQKYEEQQIAKLTSKKNIPTFRPGDTLKVTVKILEGERSRLQAFEGICISRKNNSLNSKFTVRKISHGEGVERVFPLFSSIIDKIEVIRKGDIRRAKLYYLKNRKGKSARIADKDRGEEEDQYIMSEGLNENVQKNENNSETPINENSDREEIKNTEKKNTEQNLTEKKAEEAVTKESESPASKAEETKDEKKS
tara:strand:+ start:179 stop:775 length:597 start_codon:yes stop_codon:yes gene_type:complete